MRVFSFFLFLIVFAGVPTYIHGSFEWHIPLYYWLRAVAWFTSDKFVPQECLPLFSSFPLQCANNLPRELHLNEFSKCVDGVDTKVWTGKLISVACAVWYQRWDILTVIYVVLAHLFMIGTFTFAVFGEADEKEKNE